MFQSISDVNFVTVLLGGVIYMFVGGLWYGPIAGKAWLNEMGMTEEEVKASGSPMGAMIKSFVSAIILSFGLAVLFTLDPFKGAGAVDGAIIGAFLSIIIVGGATFPNYAFESKNLRHFLIHLGASTVSMALIGAMMATW